MADTERSLNELLTTLFQDGQIEGISAQDVRDLIVSLTNPRGGLYIADGDAAQTTISAANTYTRVAGTTTEDPASVVRDFSMPGNNQLQYDGSIQRPVMVRASLSVRVVNNNTDLEFALGKNGTPILGRSEQELAFGNANELKLVTLGGYIDMQSGDEVGVFVQNLTDAGNLTAESMVVQAIGFLE